MMVMEVRMMVTEMRMIVTEVRMMLHLPRRITLMKWTYVHVGCNCCPFVQTSVSSVSMLMTGTNVRSSMRRKLGKYNRYTLATVCYISTTCFMPLYILYIL